MSWRTSRIAIGLRNMGRFLRINSLIARCLLGSKYEEKFDIRLFRAISPGDTIWDVGANVGYYTSRFAEQIGLGGKVYAFEPSRLNRERLSQATNGHRNVSILPLGLGDRNSILKLRQGDDSLGATSQVIAVTESDEVTEDVTICRADELVGNGTATVPNVIKIDVEGYELEVLKGMPNLLCNPRLRAVGIEVHFGLLAKRGMPYGGSELERLLRGAGFSCQWVDSSHVFAWRAK